MSRAHSRNAARISVKLFERNYSVGFIHAQKLAYANLRWGLIDAQKNVNTILSGVGVRVNKDWWLVFFWKHASWYVVYSVSDASLGYSLFPTPIYLHKRWVVETRYNSRRALYFKRLRYLFVIEPITLTKKRKKRSSNSYQFCFYKLYCIRFWSPFLLESNSCFAKSCHEVPKSSCSAFLKINNKKFQVNERPLRCIWIFLTI